MNNPEKLKALNMCIFLGKNILSLIICNVQASHNGLMHNLGPKH